MKDLWKGIAIAAIWVSVGLFAPKADAIPIFALATIATGAVISGIKD